MRSELAEFPFFPLFAFERRKPVCALQSVNNKNSAKLRVAEFKKCKFFARKGKSTVNPVGLASILTHYCGKFAFLNRMTLTSLCLSYDDGMCYDVKLAEIINKKGLKCTFNINSGLFPPDEPGGQWRMSRKEAARFYVNSGHEVALHGLTHPFLERLTPGEITYEVLKDRENIEEMTGAPVRGMAYPYGAYSDTVVSVLESCGIAYSRTVESTENFDVETDWLRLKPTCHHSNPKLMSLCDEFFADRRPWDQKPLVFYLWGHSFEFNNNNNWEILERFCERAGGRNDVWYATNIEIYDYVRAYNSLSFTLNGKVCQNPSAADVYFNADGKDYCVKGGETVTLTD